MRNLLNFCFTTNYGEKRFDRFGHCNVNGNLSKHLGVNRWWI